MKAYIIPLFLFYVYGLSRAEEKTGISPFVSMVMTTIFAPVWTHPGQLHLGSVD